jgi:uridine kinase
MNSAGIQRIVKRDGSTVPFNQERITNAIWQAAVAVGGKDRQRAEWLSDRVVEALNRTYGPESTPTVEEIQDLVEEILILNGHARTAKAYILYRHERAQLRAGRERDAQVADYIPYQHVYRALLWNLDHRCESVAALNTHLRGNTFPDLVQAADAAYEQEIERAARAVLERRDEIRIVIVAGPSSSGKTTTTLKLAERLRRAGLELVTLEVDNYFFDLECHPRDEFGDYDYETPQALELSRINLDLENLLAGREIRMPIYDFKVGKRRDETRPVRLGAGQVLLIDSLHGLYEEMTSRIAPARKFRLYVETLAQFKDARGEFMRWSDLRLLRRMIRDDRARGLDPRGTIEHWHYVRRSELKHIIPFIHNVDEIVNGALPYELPFLKASLFGYFPDFVARYRDQPARRDAYIRAHRVHDLLEPLDPAEDDSIVAKDSLLREFIGGGIYTD